MHQIDVIAGIFESQGKILLQYRIDSGHHSEHWGLPGGKIELGESPCEAVSRELFEELGITFSTNKKPDFRCTTADGFSFAAYVVDAYRGKIANREPNLCREVSWHLLSDLPSPLTPATAQLIALYSDEAL